MLEVPTISRAKRGSGLVELVEPLFLYICKLNRVARNQGAMGTSRTSAPFAAHALSFEQTRVEIVRLLTVMKDESAGDVLLGKQFDLVEMPLLFFVDSLLAESQLPFRDRWHENRLAAERGELAGDEKFFDMLDLTLADATEEATERLVIFFTCLGLGFSGKYAGDTVQIDTRMQRITHRIRRGWLQRDLEKRLCTQCYEHTNKSDLPKPSRDSVTRIVTVWAFGLITLIVVYVRFYNRSAGELESLLNSVLASSAPANSP